MGFANDIIGGAAALIRAAIKSPNFLTGSTGWSINKDGSAEFNNVTIRGGQVISGTALYYSGVPAAGNLIASITSAAGTDSQGNAYLAGITSYFHDVAHSQYIATQHTANSIQFLTAPTEAGPWSASGNSVTATVLGLFLSGNTSSGPAITLSPSGGPIDVQGAFTVNGVLTATGGSAATPTVVTTDSWQPLTVLAGFTAGTPAPAAKMGPDLTVSLRGIVSLNGATAAATAFASLPSSAYQPAHGAQYVTRNTLSGYAAGVASFTMAAASTSLSTGASGIAGNVIQLDGVRFPLD